MINRVRKGRGCGGRDVLGGCFFFVRDWYFLSGTTIFFCRGDYTFMAGIVLPFFLSGITILSCITKQQALILTRLLHLDFSTSTTLPRLLFQQWTQLRAFVVWRIFTNTKVAANALLAAKVLGGWNKFWTAWKSVRGCREEGRKTTSAWVGVDRMRKTHFCYFVIFFFGV